MMNRKQGVPDPDSTGLNHIIVKALRTRNMAMDNTIYKSTSEHFIIKMLFKQGSKNENIFLLQFCTNVC
jgi:hypothetical protein